MEIIVKKIDHVRTKAMNILILKVIMLNAQQRRQQYIDC